MSTETSSAGGAVTTVDATVERDAGRIGKVRFIDPQSVLARMSRQTDAQETSAPA